MAKKVKDKVSGISNKRDSKGGHATFTFLVWGMVASGVYGLFALFDPSMNFDILMALAIVSSCFLLDVLVWQVHFWRLRKEQEWRRGE